MNRPLSAEKGPLVTDLSFPVWKPAFPVTPTTVRVQCNAVHTHSMQNRAGPRAPVPYLGVGRLEQTPGML